MYNTKQEYNKMKGVFGMKKGIISVLLVMPKGTENFGNYYKNRFYFIEKDVKI